MRKKLVYAVASLLCTGGMLSMVMAVGLGAVPKNKLMGELMGKISPSGFTETTYLIIAIALPTMALVIVFADWFWEYVRFRSDPVKDLAKDLKRVAKLWKD